MKLVVLTALLLLVLPDTCSASDGENCYTSGGVAGIVIATVVVTIVMGGLAAAAIWYLWKQRSALGEKKKPGSTFFTSAAEKNCSAMDPTLSEKVRPPEGGGKEAYAFDNPYFKDDETDGRSKSQDAAEKGESGFRADNGNIRTVHDNKVNAAPKQKRSRPFANLQFPNVFHSHGGKKTRALDDTFIPKPLERVEVPLRGHDFTGLGFNICGNMRDGIFVKDVLHRGPASESGKIKAGDRIVGVWVSFSGMVYEDALTILSYASPYDVRLELEKTVDPGKSLALPASSPASKTRQVSSSFRTGQRLFHPLYRSQSFDDLTQIGKETNPPLNNNNNTTTLNTNPNSCNSCPKRSQSIEAATSPKPRMHQEPIGKPSRKSSSSSNDSAKRSSPAKAVPKDDTVMSQSPKMKSSAVEKVILVQQSPAIPPFPPQFHADDVKESELTLSGMNPNEVTLEEIPKPEEAEPSSEEDRPTAPPRKTPGHSKRKAPAPPKDQQDSSKTKTSAIVHREAEDDLSSREQQASGETNESLNTENLGEANDVQSLSGDSASPPVPAEGDPGSSPKRKASSMGDLTRLDSGRKKKSPATATILERAVSLDLQQSLPEGNLVKQKMILKTPTLEHPEDSSEEDLLPEAEAKKPPTSLDRWDGNWLKLQEEKSSAEAESPRSGLWPIVDVNITSGITNGHSERRDDSEDQGSYFAFESPFTKTTVDEKVLMKATSTPVNNCLESEFFKNSVDIDDIPYLGDLTLNSELDESTTSHATAPPISLSIPVIKPNFSQYEMLPSPGKVPNSQPSPSSPPAAPSEDQRHDVLGQDIDSIESSYRPVFSSSSFRESTTTTSSDDANSTVLSAMDIVNGNGLETTASSSYSQYRTALEDSDTCILESKSSKEVKSRALPEVTSIKVHGGAAGFAKTLIICSPIEGESISLNADLDTPPPTLEPPV